MAEEWMMRWERAVHGIAIEGGGIALRFLLMGDAVLACNEVIHEHPAFEKFKAPTRDP